MNYPNTMYGRNKFIPPQTPSDKNPNRVTGGLKGKVLTHLTMLGKMEPIANTSTHVQSLKSKSKQRAAISVLERKLTRQEANITNLQNRGR